MIIAKEFGRSKFFQLSTEAGLADQSDTTGVTVKSGCLDREPMEMNRPSQNPLMDRKGVTVLVSAVATIAFLMSGCRGAQLHKDQDDFRWRLNQMHTDQIMDNLIRCQAGLPFVHLDFGKVTGTVTQKAAGAANESQTVLDDSTLNGLGVLTALRRSISTVYGFSLAGENTNQLTVTAEPVLTTPGVYRAYLEFLAVDGSLLQSPDPPPEDAALICKEYCGCYYWVPVEFRSQFRELALRTNGIRGEAVEGPATWDTTILGVVGQTPGDDITDPAGVVFAKAWELTLEFTSDVPNAAGTFRAVINGRIYSFPVFPIDEIGQRPPAGRGVTKSRKLRTTFVHDFRPFEMLSKEDLDNGHMPVSPEQIAESFEQQNVKIDIPNVRPPVSSTKDLLKSIEHELELFRLDQQRLD